MWYIEVECTPDSPTINVTNLAQRLTNNQLVDCVQKNTVAVKAIAELQTALDQVSKERSAANVTAIVIIVCIVLALIVGATVFLRLRSNPTPVYTTR